MHSWTIHEKIFMNIHVHEDSWVLRYPVFATPKSVNGHKTWLGSWTSSAVTSAGLPRIIHLILGMYAPSIHKVNRIHSLGEPAWLASSAESSAHFPRCWPNNNFAPWSNESLFSFTVNKSMNCSWTSSADFFRSLPPIFRGSSAMLANWYVSKWRSNTWSNHQRFTLSGLNLVRQYNIQIMKHT